MYYLIGYSFCRDGKEITLEARDKNYIIHYAWQHIAQALVMAGYNHLNCCAPMSSLEGLFSSLTHFIIGKYFLIFSLNPSFPNLTPLLLIMPSIELQIISLPPWCLQPPDTFRLLLCPLCYPPAEWDVFGSAFISLELSLCFLSQLPYHGPLLSSKPLSSPFPASVLPWGTLVGVLLTELDQKGCPYGVSLCPAGRTLVPMTCLGSHWCFFPISCIFSDPAMFPTCFAFLLSELFSAPLHPREKRDRNGFFLLPWAAGLAELLQTHHRAISFSWVFFQAEKLNPSGYLRDDWC